ncbi:Signal transduction histidine kinase [Amycolatopsis marina]|uniref:histidine kinase n=1 Tax=Amycolatopsis marina TaxID=490629 RepID=A0A1I1AVJ1_9PSEU|nr:HAMP domain-containing sensor histidine kinase [Amycolatopsis marina]SFB40448.1 Signal transduction histidine kinase [Amycolatopsis marina]
MTVVFTRSALFSSTLTLVTVLLTAVVLDLTCTRRSVGEDYRRQAHLVGAVVLVSTDGADIGRVLARAPAGAEGRLAVHLPDGRSFGTSGAPQTQVAEVAGTRRALAFDDSWSGESTYLHPVVISDTEVAVVEVRIPVRWFSSGFGTRFALLLMAGLASIALALTLVRIRTKPVVDATGALAKAANQLEPDALPVSLSPRVPEDLRSLRAGLIAIAGRWANLRTDERKLIADLSHRLRTPLTALRLDAESLVPDVVSERIRRSINALETEVDEVINRSDAPPPPAATWCDLGAVVRERMGFWTTLAENQARESLVDLTSSPTEIALPEKALRSLFDALLVNVFHHTPPGTPFAVVVVSHANWVTLVVDDGGKGIADPEAALRRGSSGAGSTGLGLDIARTCVEEIGGSIHLEQSSLGGARVRLRFPEAGRRATSEAPRAWRLGKRTRREWTDHAVP